VVAPAIPEKPARPAAVERVSPPKSESSPALIVDTTRDEPAPPTFFPGAYDGDEEEGGGKTKAIVIVAAVVLLACSAGYLSLKNMNSGKSAAAATPAVTSAPAPAPAATKPAATEPASQPVATDITLGGSDASSATATHTTANKPSPKTPATKTSSESDTEPEVVQRLIVKQDAAHTSKPAASQDAEQVQAPSAIGMGATTDTNTLASIGNTPVNVPKAVPQTVKVSQGVMEGLVIKRVQPRYPTQALQMRIQGPVQLQATITKNGDIQNLKVVSGDLVLARAAQEAVKQWKYKPYFLNGEPVAIETQILVNFRLPN
jgi:protein TonB